MRSVPHRVVCLLGLDDGVFPRRRRRRRRPRRRRPPGRRPRPAQRGPPAAARRAAGRRPSRLIVTYSGHDERTNADRARRPCRSGSCSTSSTAPSAPDDRRRARDADRRAPPPAAVRRPQLHARRARRRRRHGASTPSPWPAPGPPVGARAAAGAVPARAAPAAADRRAVELDDLVRVRAAPRARRSCASASALALSEAADDGSRRAARRARPARGSGASGERLLDGAAGGRADRDACVAAERRAGRLPPGRARPSRPDRARAAGRRRLVAGGGRRRRRTPPSRALGGRDVALGGRALARRARWPACAGDVLPRGHLLRAWRRKPAPGRLGAVPGPDRRPPRAAVRGGTVGRVRRGGPALAEVTIARLPPLGDDAGRPPGSGPWPSSRVLVDLLRPGPARAAARCTARRRPPTPRPHAPAGRRGRRRRRVGSGYERLAARTWSRSTSSSSAACCRSPSCSGAAAAGRGRRRLGGRRDHALRPLRPPAVGRGSLDRDRGEPTDRSRVSRGAAAPFDVCGPLPEPGVTVLEASAGTGKTFTIAALAARYVAEGIPLDQLLLVTFTRMATGELRDRVRERLVCAEQGLRARRWPVRRRTRTTTSSGCSPQGARRGRERAPRAPRRRARRLRRGHHRHHPRLLPGRPRRPGRRRRRGARTGLVEDVDDLIEEVVDDLYVRQFHGADVPRRSAAPRRSQIAAPAVEQPRRADRAARGRRARRSPAMRRRLADAVRKEMERRKRRAGVLTYDDLLIRLATRCADRDGARGGGQAAGPLPGGAGRRVPGHRPRPVGHPAARRSARRRRRWSSSATPSRPSTPSGAPTCTPTWTPPTRPAGGRRSTSTGAATRASSTPTTRCFARRPARPRGHRLPRRCGPPPPTRRRACSAPRWRRRCGCGCSTATRRLVDLTRSRAGPGRLHPPASSPTTWPATSSRLLSSGGRGRDPRATTAPPAPRAGPAGPRRGAGPHQPAGRPGAGRAGRRRHPRRHQRRRQRVRHAVGPGVAAAARGRWSGRRPRRAPARPR